ncbi:LysE family translocator [Agrobacterium larrymoorei]|uniref:LysE family translocator n=1 Tax=Agrobacterium larrymoorei TaxID=160699 RepID=UPI0030BFB886
MSEFTLFIGALVVVYLLPGPDMVLVLQTGANAGRGPAIATGAGLALARAAHVALAGLGLAALLTTSPMAFEVVRFVGAAYLLWLGLEILRSEYSEREAMQIERGREPPSHGTALCRGFLTNILNPKALLFCSVLLPQFITPGGEGLGVQFLMLGMTLVVVGLAFDLTYATAGSWLSGWISRRPLAQRAQNWAFAVLLIGFALRLVVMPHP